MSPAPKPKATPPAPRWYELDNVKPYRDLLVLLGALIVVIGLGMIWKPLAVITFGAGLVFLGWRLAK